MPRSFRELLVDRRDFLRYTGLAVAATLGAPATLLTGCSAYPYAPEVTSIRVQGQVASRGRGLSNVMVTDGLSVVLTDSEGQYELVTSSQQSFIYISLPSGYRIPVNGKGTARFYQPIRSNARGEMTAVFDLDPIEGSDERHAFFLLADPQTLNTRDMGFFHDEVVPDVLSIARQFGDISLFGIACGDIMFDNLSLFPEYERAVARIGLPFFQVVGNHDVIQANQPNAGSTAIFEGHFGPTYYSFNRGLVHYVVLDDVFWEGSEYYGYIPDIQIQWLKADLELVEPGSPVVVFLHVPLLSMFARRHGTQARNGTWVENREALYQLLEPYRAHVLSAHMHEHGHVFEGGVHEHVHGTVCGAFWSGPICLDGTPNGYSVYEIQGEEIRWYYKGTGLAASEQIRVYPRGADPMAPGEVVANVWDWDPEWSVVLYEDGSPRGSMIRRTRPDPLAVELYGGKEKPLRWSWVDPVPTDHLFYASVSPSARDVRVDATDRWGRTYTAVLQQP